MLCSRPTTLNRRVMVLVLYRRHPAPSREAGSFFGLCAVTLMLVTYALEARSCWFTLAFAGSCALGSAYGFLQGAWPFGVVEGIWALVALDKWRKR